MSKRVMAECHPDKPNAGRGLCWACYARAKRAGTLPAKRVDEAELDRIHGLAPPANAPRCSICAIPAFRSVKVLRFTLVRSVSLPDGRKTSRGAGAILLCERCWRQVTTRARQRRRTARRAA